MDQQRPSPAYRRGQRLRVVTIEGQWVNGKSATVMAEPRWVEGAWIYDMDLFPPYDRSWTLREDELRPWAE